MAGSETLELIVNLKGTGIDGLKALSEEIKKASSNASTSGTASLKALSKEIQSVGDSSAQAAVQMGGLQKVASSLSTVFKLLGTVLATKAVVDWVKESITAFAEFDDILRQTKAVTGATADEFKRMGELAIEMGDSTSFSAKEAATTLRLLAMAGLSASDAMKALPNVMQLSMAGALGLSEAVQASTSIINTFGLSVDQLASVNNVLVRAQKDTGISVADLHKGLATVGPLAHSVGADFEDLVGTLGRMHKGGVEAATAATALRTVMDGLLNPTSAEVKMMNQLSDRIGGVGLQLKDSQGRFVGFLSIIQQLEKAGVTSGEALRLFGTRAGPAMAALLNQGSAKLAETIGYVRQLDDEAKKTADEMEEGLGGAFRAMGSASEALKLRFGAIFADDVRQLVIYFKDELLRLVETVKELRDNGTLTGWADDVKAAFTSIGTLIDFAVLGPIKLVTKGLLELANTARGAAAVVRGELSKTDFAKSSAAELDERLRDISNNPQVAKWRVQLKEVEKEITDTQKNISMAAAMASTEFDQSIDVEGETEKLGKLQEEWKRLAVAIAGYGKALAQIPEDQVVNPDHNPEFGGGAATGGLANIGRAGVGVIKPSTLETEEQKKAREARSKAELAAYAANAKEFQALLNDTYQVGLIAYEKNVNERMLITFRFYEAQKQAAIDQSAFEVARLQELANKERAGSAERIKLDSDIVVKKKELSTELIGIETKRYEAEYQLAKEAKAKREQLEGIKKDIDIRIQANQVDNPFEREQTEQTLRLEERHRLEMEALKKLTDDEAVLNDAARAQELEKQRLHEDQVRNLRLMQLDAAKQVAGGVEQLMTALYEGSGKKVKAFFYIAKAAAMAEAVMNIAQGVTKALGQGGYYGIFMGAAVAASGAVQLSKIASQQMAAGGIVAGSSPTTKSDDKLIAATSGEYMQPVKAVRTYGVEFMNAIRNLQFPRELAAGFTASYPLTSASRRGYASGGVIGATPSATRGLDADKSITINNLVDPNVFGQYLASAPGNRQFLNVISNNQFAVKQILFSNG
jgi:TP901 family phage tail tape measure protein